MNGDRVSFLNFHGYEFVFLPRPRPDMIYVFLVDDVFRPLLMNSRMIDEWLSVLL